MINLFYLLEHGAYINILTSTTVAVHSVDYRNVIRDMVYAKKYHLLMSVIENTATDNTKTLNWPFF